LPMIHTPSSSRQWSRRSFAGARPVRWLLPRCSPQFPWSSSRPLDFACIISLLCR
jgi:hypothetical protein